MKQDSLFPNPSARKPSHEEIAAAAYHLYLESGSRDGNDLEHWFRAEQLLTQREETRAARAVKSRTASSSDTTFRATPRGTTLRAPRVTSSSKRATAAPAPVA